MRGSSGAYFNRSTDGGASWSPTIQLNTVAFPSGDTFPQIVASGSAVYVTWHDKRNGKTDVFFNRSLDSGATWLPADTWLDTPGTTSRFPQIRATGSDVYVAWKNLAVSFNRTADAGTTWMSTPIRLDDNGVPESLVLTSTNEHVYAIWSDFRNGDGDVYFNIPFGLQPYGAGTPGSAGNVPMLVGSGRPLRGDSVSLDVANAISHGTATLLVGLQPASQISFPLLGGTILVAPSIDLPFTLDGLGTATVPLVLPDNPALRGWNANFQAVILDLGGPGGLAMSNAIAMWFG